MQPYGPAANNPVRWFSHQLINSWQLRTVYKEGYLSTMLRICRAFTLISSCCRASFMWRAWRSTCGLHVWRADAATFIRQSLQLTSLTLSGSPWALSASLKYCQIGAFDIGVCPITMKRCVTPTPAASLLHAWAQRCSKKWKVEGVFLLYFEQRWMLEISASAIPVSPTNSDLTVTN